MPIRPIEVGPEVEAIQHHHAQDFPEPVPGKHLWIVSGAWRVGDNFDPTKQIHLDTENLITLEGPGCMWCEEVWTPERAAKPCPGDASP